MQECKASSVPVGGGMEGEEWYEQRNEDMGASLTSQLK